jgi:ribonuclease-3
LVQAIATIGTVAPAGRPHPLVDALGVDLDAALLTQARTHRSYTSEHSERVPNERLEFLGDAVLE